MVGLFSLFPLFSSSKKGNITPPSFGAPANAYNWNPATQFINFKAAKARLIAGTDRCRVGFDGDSTTVGVGASNVGYRGLSSSAKAVDYINNLASRKYNAGFDSLCGYGNGPGADATRIALVGGAGYSGPSGFGGPTYQLYAAGDGIDITLKTPRVFDRVNASTFQANSGTIDIGLNGGALTGTPTTNDNSSNILYKTYNVPRQSYSVINVRRVAGQPLLEGIDCYDSLAPRMDIYNGGSGGADASSIANGSGTLLGLISRNPHLAIINYGINDGNSLQKTKALYKSQVLSGVQALQAINCDVLLLVTTPINTGSAMESGTPPLWSEYRDALQEIAIAQNVPLINLHDRYVSYATQNAKNPSWMSDGLHPNALLYADLGAFLGDILLNI